MKYTRAVALLLFAAATAMAYAQNPAAPAEQSHFSVADTGVQKPIPIPGTALAILREDRSVQDALQAAKLPLHKLPSEWFAVSEIHLGQAGARDFIVVGKGPLVGANLASFWVFLSTTSGLELALKAVAHDLVVKNTRTKAYRNIAITTATEAQVTTITFHFDGDRYHTFARGTQSIHQGSR